LKASIGDWMHTGWMRHLALGLVLLASCGGELTQEDGDGSSHSSASEGGADCCVGVTRIGSSAGSSTATSTTVETLAVTSTAAGSDAAATSSADGADDACTALGSCCLMIGFNNEPACGASMETMNTAFCSMQLAVFSDAGLCPPP